jgi:predicted HTH transcriptional regulator
MLFSDRLEIWNPGRLPPPLTLKALRGPHGSVPHNPLLAEPLYLTKYIEQLGTGTRDMIASCRKAGLPEPEFGMTDGFVLTVRRSLRLGEKLGEKLGETRTAIIGKMRVDPGISISRLAENLGISTTAVEKNIAFLKSAGYIERIGPAKGGYWKVSADLT